MRESKGKENKQTRKKEKNRIGKERTEKKIEQKDKKKIVSEYPGVGKREEKNRKEKQ